MHVVVGRCTAGAWFRIVFAKSASVIVGGGSGIELGAAAFLQYLVITESAMSGTSPVKTVVLVGKTGDGKSTVAYMLSSGDLGGEFAAANSLVAVTSGTVVATNPSLNWRIIDTEGMLASENLGADEKRVEELRKFLGRLEHPWIDVFCYVKKASRFTRADEQCWKSFLALLADTDYHHDNILLVFTSCSEGPEWVEQSKGILDQHMAGTPPYQKVAVDFPPRSTNPDVESVMKEARKTSLERLKKAVESSGTKGPLRLPDQSSPFGQRANVWQSGVPQILPSALPKVTDIDQDRSKSCLPCLTGRKHH